MHESKILTYEGKDEDSNEVSVEGTHQSVTTLK